MLAITVDGKAYSWGDCDGDSLGLRVSDGACKPQEDEVMLLAILVAEAVAEERLSNVILVPGVLVLSATSSRHGRSVMLMAQTHGTGDAHSCGTEGSTHMAT